MKRKLLILAIGVVLLAIIAPRAESDRPYVGLFADADHASMSVYMPPGSTSLPFTIWVWWYPGDQGLMGSEFRLGLPINVTLVATEQNSGVCAPAVGCYWPCLCCTCSECQTDWHWSWRIDCILTDSNPDFIRIESCGEDPMIYAANCSVGNPLEPVIPLNDLGLNQPVGIGVEVQTWGAIKELYR